MHDRASDLLYVSRNHWKIVIKMQGNRMQV